MTAEQFVYWLQGFMEINDPDTISKSETRVIKNHLALVFDKQTPTAPSFNPNQTPPFFPSPATTVTAPADAPWIPKVVCETNTPPHPVDIHSINQSDLIMDDTTKIDKLMNEIQLPVSEDFNNITTISNDNIFNRVRLYC